MLELDDTVMGVIGILAGILIFAGAVLWLVYGMALDDVYIIGVNLAAMVLTMIVLSMKLKYERAAQTISE